MQHKSGTALSWRNNLLGHYIMPFDTHGGGSMPLGTIIVA